MHTPHLESPTTVLYKAVKALLAEGSAQGLWLEQLPEDTPELNSSVLAA